MDMLFSYKACLKIPNHACYIKHARTLTLECMACKQQACQGVHGGLW